MKISNRDKIFVVLFSSLISFVAFGQKDSFPVKDTNSILIADSFMFQKGYNDAKKYYSSYFPALSTGISSAIFFPFGILVGVNENKKKFKDKDLNVPDIIFLENFDYRKGYIQKAKKKRKKDVLIALVVGSTINIAFLSHYSWKRGWSINIPLGI